MLHGARFVDDLVQQVVAHVGNVVGQKVLLQVSLRREASVASGTSERPFLGVTSEMDLWEKIEVSVMTVSDYMHFKS